MSRDPVPALRKQLIAAILERLEALRRATGGEATQGELAQMLGLTRPRLNLLMNKRTEAFSVEALARIASRCGLSVRLTATRPYARA